MAVEPTSVGHHAAENLRFIRSAMERSSTFTAIPGAGGAAMGGIALGAAAVARSQHGERWLFTWLAAAALAAVIGLAAMTHKARANGVALSGNAARRFALGMAAPFVAGAAITYELWAAGEFQLMAPVWLLLYGTGVLTGGMLSLPVVRAIGLCFMACGIAAIVTPHAWADAWLAIGFGGLQLGFGTYIARNHGG